GDTLFFESRNQHENVVDLRCRESRHRLVRDEELWLRRHRARKLELPHVHLREPAGKGVRLVGQADLLEEVHRRVGDLALAQFDVLASRVFQRYAEIVEHRHADKRSRNLKGPRESKADATVWWC